MDKFDLYIHNILNGIEEHELKEKLSYEEWKVKKHRKADYNPEYMDFLIDCALDERNEEDFHRLVKMKKMAGRMGLG